MALKSHFSSKANSVALDKHKDIVAAINEFTFRVKPQERLEALLPTLPNLYGLDVRFKYTERMIKAEKDRKKVTSSKRAPSGTGPKQDMAYANSPPPNRHGHFSQKNYVSPISYKVKFRNKQSNLFNTAQVEANATGTVSK